jgi:hypothetical protein
MAGLRTQPGQADTVTSLETEQCIMGTAMASLAFLSFEMENPVRTVNSMSQNKQVISLDRLETHSAQDTTLVDIINGCGVVWHELTSLDEVECGWMKIGDVQVKEVG